MIERIEVIATTQNEQPYEYVWRGKTRYPERYGHPCRMVELSTPGSFGERTVVQFEDGTKVAAHRKNIRRRTSR